MRRVLAGLLCLALSAVSARAAAVFSFNEVGPDVVGTLSGTLDLTGLTPSASNFSGAGIVPVTAFLVEGTSSSANAFDVTGPSSFGSGILSLADSRTGDPLALAHSAGLVLVLPTTYSGGALAASMTFLNQSFASLGVNPGDYLYQLGNSDTFTVRFGAAPPPSPVPVPGTIGLLGSALGGIGVAALRRRRLRA